jgi:hypothetical protein
MEAKECSEPDLSTAITVSFVEKQEKKRKANMDLQDLSRSRGGVNLEIDERTIR